MSDFPGRGSDPVPGITSQQGILGGSPFQQLDTDIQLLTKAVNRIADILKPTPQVVTGSRAGNAALASLLAALAANGFIVDNTTP